MGLNYFSALMASFQRAYSETSILKVELSMLHFVKLYLVFAQWIHLVSADGSASHPQVFKDFNFFFSPFLGPSTDIGWKAQATVP